MAHKLPGELWLYIFSVGELEDAWHRGGLQRYCGERAQFLSTCSLVCRDWRELAQPLLFRNPVLRDCQLERWLSVLPTCKAAQVQWTVSREFRFTFRHTTNVLPRELGRDALKGLPRPSGRKKRVFFACDAACGDACLLKIDRCFIKELVDCEQLVRFAYHIADTARQGWVMLSCCTSRAYGSMVTSHVGP